MLLTAGVVAFEKELDPLPAKIQYLYSLIFVILEWGIFGHDTGFNSFKGLGSECEARTP